MCVSKGKGRDGKNFMKLMGKDKDDNVLEDEERTGRAVNQGISIRECAVKRDIPEME